MIMDRICSICLGDLDNEGIVCNTCNFINDCATQSDWDVDGPQPSAREVAIDEKICLMCRKTQRVYGYWCQACNDKYMENIDDPYLEDDVNVADFDEDTQSRFKVITNKIRKFLGL